MSFIGTGRRLSPDDFARAAKRIGCDVAAIRAVCHVEARGEGFDAKNRPVILPERHVFYRNLSGAKRQAAVNQALLIRLGSPGGIRRHRTGATSSLTR